MGRTVEGLSYSRFFGKNTPTREATTPVTTNAPTAVERFISKLVGPLVAQEAFVDYPWLIAVAPVKAAETPEPPPPFYAEYLQEEIPDTFAKCKTYLDKMNFVQSHVGDLGLPDSPSQADNLSQAVTLLTRRLMARKITDVERLGAYAKDYVDIRSISNDRCDNEVMDEAISWVDQKIEADSYIAAFSKWALARPLTTSDAELLAGMDEL